jgi:ABC-type proline/glycine betaine transport system permease subunit
LLYSSPSGFHAVFSDSGFDEKARDRFSNLFVFTRGHLLVINVVVGFCVPRGRRFSIASCLVCLYSSLIIGIATIPNTSPTVAISLFIVAIFGETIFILLFEFTLAPPVHLHIMSERHGGETIPLASVLLFSTAFFRPARLSWFHPHLTRSVATQA